MKLKKAFSNIALVLQYYIKYVPVLFFGEFVFTVFVSFIWAVQGPVTTKYLLDALVNRKPLQEVLLFLVVITILVFVRHVYACYIVEYLQTVAGITIQEKLLKELHEKAAGLDLEYYETPEFYTDYVWAAQQATSQFQKIYRSFVVLVARISETVFMGGVMIALDPILLIFAVTMALIRFVAQRKQIGIRYEANMEAKPLERERIMQRGYFI